MGETAPIRSTWILLSTLLLSVLLACPSTAAGQTAAFDDPVQNYFKPSRAIETPAQRAAAEMRQDNRAPAGDDEVEQEDAEGESPDLGTAEAWRTDDEPQEIKAEFGNGFSLVSEDEEFELTIHILNQVDYKLFSPSDQEPAAIDGVYIPRMRLYFEGKLTDPFHYEVSLQRSLEGAFDLLDANLDVKFREELQIRFGRSLIPYSYAWYDHLEQYFIAPERPLFPLNLGLSRSAGVQIWGADPNRQWQYSVGAYDGRLSGLADNSTTTDVASYVNFRPFVISRPDGLLQNLNLGGSLVLGKARRPAELLPFRTSIQGSENDEAASAASAVFFEFDDEVVQFGDRVLGAVHAACYSGPVSLETEWNVGQVELLNEGTGETVDVIANGFNVTLASFVTGEQVQGREEVRPLRPFDPRCGLSQRGALEPFARYSYLYLGEEVFDRGLANEDDWTNEVSMTDIGVNWYLNRFTKFTFDWQHSAYGSPVLVNERTGQVSNRNDLYWFRCQFYF